jgi:hypothetical protein
MKNDIINIPQIDKEALRKEWNIKAEEANDVIEMTKTKGWEIVKKNLENTLENSYRNIVLKMTDWNAVKDSILIAKAVMKILLTVESYQSKKETLEKNLKSLKKME